MSGIVVVEPFLHKEHNDDFERCWLVALGTTAMNYLLTTFSCRERN